MDFELNSEQLAVQKMVREFVEKEITPNAKQWDLDEKFPMDTWKKMGDLGIIGTSIPEEYEGSGMDFISHAIVAEELGYGCSSMRGSYSVNISLVAKTILKWGTEEQKKKYIPPIALGEAFGCYGLTEPDSGSDAASMKSGRRKDGDFTSSRQQDVDYPSNMADVLFFCQTDKDAGQGLYLLPGGQRYPRFDPRLSRKDLVFASQDTGEIYMEKCASQGPDFGPSAKVSPWPCCSR